MKAEIFYYAKGMQKVYLRDSRHPRTIDTLMRYIGISPKNKIMISFEHWPIIHKELGLKEGKRRVLFYSNIPNKPIAEMYQETQKKPLKWGVAGEPSNKEFYLLPSISLFYRSVDKNFYIAFRFLKWKGLIKCT